MGSVGAKITDDTGAAWDLRRARGPRCGVVVEVVSLRRLELREKADDRREVGAGGASDFLLDQTPTVWSAEAERMRLEGWCTAMESTLALCP